MQIQQSPLLMKQKPQQNEDLSALYSHHSANQDTEMLPHQPYSGFQFSEDNDRQMLRLVQQYLQKRGHEDLAKELSLRSKVRMEEEVVNDFRQAVLNGDYKRARELATRMNIREANSDESGFGRQGIKRVEYEMFEQEYLELIESARKLDAIQILQREMLPRVLGDKVATERLHVLAQLIMCGDPNGVKVFTGNNSSELRKVAGSWKGSGLIGRQDLLERLQGIMPANEMLQPHRLEHLVKQGLSFQIQNCHYHNVSSGGQQTNLANTSFSLLEDHKCERHSMIPTKCLAILQKHKDEVWQVKFSPCGTRFASIGKDNLIYIWSITKSSKTQNSQSGILSQKQTGKYRIKCTHEIKGHVKNITSLNWSYTPEDKQAWLVTTSNDSSVKVWDASRSGRLVVEIAGQNSQEQMMCASFLPGYENTRILTLTTDKLLTLWEIRATANVIEASSAGPLTYSASELTRVQTRNFKDIAVHSNRIVLMGQSHFQVFNIGKDLVDTINDREQSYEVETTEPLSSIALSNDGRYLLANLSFIQPRLELYDLGAPNEPGHRKAELIKRYKGGHTQTCFVLRCGFGGAHENFVFCGSEDASITLWNRDKGDIITKLPSAHSSVINSIAWSPVDPYVFVTCSDDHTIKLWGTETMSPFEVHLDTKDIRRVDLLRAAPSGLSDGNSKIYQLHGVQSDDEDDDEHLDEDEEEAMQDEDDDEEENTEYRLGSASHYPVLQATRIIPANSVREEEGEDEEDERMAGARNPRSENEEESDEWAGM